MVRRSTVLAVVAVAALAGVAGAWAADAWPGGEQAGDEDVGDDHARVVVETANGTVTLEMAVADTPEERHQGLSGTEELPADGMVFVYPDAGERAYVMREMNYPLDIVFVANGEVTAIHHAPVEDPPLTRYSGRARYVLELPYGWTTEHGVTVGDDVSVYFGS